MAVELVVAEQVEQVETRFFSTLEVTVVQAYQVQLLGRQLIMVAVVAVESMKTMVRTVV
jgi:hypothetical protein